MINILTFLIMLPVLIVWFSFGWLLDKTCRVFGVSYFLYDGSNFMLYILGPIGLPIVLIKIIWR